MRECDKCPYSRSTYAKSLHMWVKACTVWDCVYEKKEIEDENISNNAGDAKRIESAREERKRRKGENRGCR